MFGFPPSFKKRLKYVKSRHALVDGIPFKLPVSSEKTPAIMAGFSIDAKAAKAMMPAEIHPLIMFDRAILVLTSIDYKGTNIGDYVEFSVAIACTHGLEPAPRMLPAMFHKLFKTGQYVVDLPVSTEISVKGGKGIWGMPKHQASLDFVKESDCISTQYDLDGQMVMRFDLVDPCENKGIKFKVPAVNYCSYRGMLFKSYVYISARANMQIGKRAKARLTIGNHPKAQWLKTLDIRPDPLFTTYIPEFDGLLDDHYEAWFNTASNEITTKPEGFESVFFLNNGEDWLAPPKRSALNTPPEHTEQSTPSHTAENTMSPENVHAPIGFGFSETMSGDFTLANTDPRSISDVPNEDKADLAMHATIKIEDLNKFISDPTHTGSITGSIDYAPFAMNMPSTKGVFNLFSPDHDPEMKLMIYEFGFTHEGQDYYLAGKKEVKDDPGFDLWSDTTTLYTTLHRGNDKTGEVIGSGILKLHLSNLMDMLPTFTTTNCKNNTEKAETIAKFGRFFLGELWEQYGEKILNREGA